MQHPAHFLRAPLLPRSVGMMAMQMQDAEDKKAAKTVAHSPVELKALKKEGIATSFAASAQN